MWRVQGEDIYPPSLQHHPDLMAARAPSGAMGYACSASGVSSCCPDNGAAPDVLPRMRHRARHLPAWVLPVCGCRVALDGQDDSPPSNAPWKNSQELPDPTIAGSCWVFSAWLSPSHCFFCSLPCIGSQAVTLCQPFRDSEAHCRLPMQLQGWVCTQAIGIAPKPVQVTLGSPDPCAGGDLLPQSLGDSLSTKLETQGREGG